MSKNMCIFSCSPHAIEILSGWLFQEVIITNTIPVKEQNYFPQLTVLSVANLCLFLIFTSVKLAKTAIKEY